MAWGDNRTQAEKDAANRADRLASKAMKAAARDAKDPGRAYAKVNDAARRRGVKF